MDIPETMRFLRAAGKRITTATRPAFRTTITLCASVAARSPKYPTEVERLKAGELLKIWREGNLCYTLVRKV